MVAPGDNPAVDQGARKREQPEVDGSRYAKDEDRSDGCVR
jgi:hypothetical protein